MSHDMRESRFNCRLWYAHSHSEIISPPYALVHILSYSTRIIAKHCRLASWNVNIDAIQRCRHQIYSFRKKILTYIITLFNYKLVGFGLEHIEETEIILDYVIVD